MRVTHNSEDTGANPALSPSRDRCLPPELIIDYGLNDLNAVIRSRVEDHIKICRQCAIKVRATLAAFEAKFGPTGPGTSEPG